MKYKQILISKCVHLRFLPHMACKFCRAKLSNQPNNIGDEATKTGCLRTPLPLPESLYARAGGRTGVRTKFSWPHGFTKNSYPWCSAGARRAQELRYKNYTNTILYNYLPYKLYYTNTILTNQELLTRHYVFLEILLVPTQKLSN